MHIRNFAKIIRNLERRALRALTNRHHNAFMSDTPAKKPEKLEPPFGCGIHWTVTTYDRKGKPFTQAVNWHPNGCEKGTTTLVA